MFSASTSKVGIFFTQQLRHLVYATILMGLMVYSGHELLSSPSPVASLQASTALTRENLFAVGLVTLFMILLPELYRINRRSMRMRLMPALVRWLLKLVVYAGAVLVPLAGIRNGMAAAVMAAALLALYMRLLQLHQPESPFSRSGYPAPMWPHVAQPSGRGKKQARGGMHSPIPAFNPRPGEPGWPKVAPPSSSGRVRAIPIGARGTMLRDQSLGDRMFQDRSEN